MVIMVVQKYFNGSWGLERSGNPQHCAVSNTQKCKTFLVHQKSRIFECAAEFVGEA